MLEEKIEQEIKRDEENKPIVSEEDKALALAWIEGSEEAIDQIYKRYHAPIYNFVWMIVRESGLCEDICQEVFLRAYQKRHLLKEPYNIGSWLFTIARNITMRQIKKNRNPKEEQVDEPGELDALAEQNPSGSRQRMLRGIHLEKLKEVMSDAMERLDPQAAEMVYLHYFEHKTFQQIADSLEVPLGTVCTKISRSLKALRKTIKRDGYHTKDVIWTRFTTGAF